MVEWKLEGEALKKADSIHRNSIVVDMSLTTNFSQPTQIINGKNGLERAMKIGGFTVAGETLNGSESRTFREVLREVNKMHRFIVQKPEEVMLVTKSSDIEKAKKEGKLGLIINFQGADCLEDQFIDTLPVFYRMGVRIIALTYNERNLLGDGCTEPKDNGLTAYGAQVVRGMNRIGVIVDLSHVGRRTAMDAIELSSDPVVFTHSNVNAITPHVRNLTDELIKAVAKKGGVIGIVVWDAICARKAGEGTLTDYLDHLDYIVKLVGVDHVGIGSDINDNMRAMPMRSDFETRYSYMLKGNRIAPGVEGFYDLEDIVNLTRGLVARGYSEGDIKKILGGNFMRVARQVWDKV